MGLWVEFSEKSQETIKRLVVASAREGRLNITLPRLDKIIERLETDTPEEVRLKKMFGMHAEIRSEHALRNYSPMAFIYQTILANCVPTHRAQ